MWASFEASAAVESAEPHWTSFDEPVVVDTTDVFGALFGTFVRSSTSVPALAALPTVWTQHPLGRLRFDIGRLVPWARHDGVSLPPPLVRIIGLDADVTSVAMCGDGASLHARWSPSLDDDAVLVDALSDAFVPLHTPVDSLAPGTTLRAELRVCYLQRRIPVLNEAVARARRSGDTEQLDKTLVDAWGLYLDSATKFGSSGDELRTVALVCETTRREGPRFVHSAMAADGGVAAGVAVLSHPTFPGMAMMAHLLHVLLSFDTPSLHQFAKLCPDGGSAPRLVYLEQQPLLSRSLLDVLLVPDAMAMRRRIDVAHYSFLFIVSILCGFASVCPEHVHVFVSDLDTGSCALGLSPRALESAFCPFESKSVGTEEVPLMCNVVFALSDELDQPVAEVARAHVRQLDAERLVLALLDTASVANDHAAGGPASAALCVC